MEDWKRRFEIKIDKIDEINSEQNVSLAKMQEILKINTQSLQEHMQRTELNEERIYEVERQAIKDRSFLKGSIWVITTVWGILITIAMLYGRYFQ